MKRLATFNITLGKKPWDPVIDEPCLSIDLNNVVAIVPDCGQTLVYLHACVAPLRVPINPMDFRVACDKWRDIEENKP